MGFSAVTVQGTYETMDGTAASGTVTFTPNEVFDDDFRMVFPTAKTATLDVNGKFSTTLFANDDPSTEPAGSKYNITENINGFTRRSTVTIPYYPMSRVLLGGPTHGTSQDRVGWVRAADNAGLSASGIIDIRIGLSIKGLGSGYYDTVALTLASKFDGGSQCSWWWYINSITKQMIFEWSTDGTSVGNPTFTSDPVPGLENGEKIRLRVFFNPATRSILFQYAAFDDTNPSTYIANANWVNLGAVQTGAPTTVFDSTSPVDIGAWGGGNYPLQGTLYEFLIWVGTTYRGETLKSLVGNDYPYTDQWGSTWSLGGAAVLRGTQVVDLAELL